MTCIIVGWAAHPITNRQEPSMPLMNLTYPEGTFTPEERTAVAESLTTALLHAERAPDTDFFRSITWVYVHEMPAGTVLASGRPVSQPTFRLDVTTPEGALSDRRRAEMVSEATRILLDAAGLNAEDSMRVWVLLHEVPEGRWGAAGEIVRFQQLVDAAKAERERADEGAPATV
jgi:phenylpyruvate tautomerase PptA (4-oxalocrotonate tautomerase family)